MDTKKNSEKEFPGLPSYYTSRNPPSEVQVKWVLDFVIRELKGKDKEILKDFGILDIEDLQHVDNRYKTNKYFGITVER